MDDAAITARARWCFLRAQEHKGYVILGDNLGHCPVTFSYGPMEIVPDFYASFTFVRFYTKGGELVKEVKLEDPRHLVAGDTLLLTITETS